MKRLLYILMAAIALVGCVNDELPESAPPSAPEGYINIEFKAHISDMESVSTRAVDPDGLAVNNMTVFCFNEYGLFISSEVATITKLAEDEGIYSAAIPSHTHIIHFLANHSKGLYDESEFPGQTESMVVANMEGGSGMLVYWSRFKMDTTLGTSISEQLEELSYVINGETRKGIKLIRNQAKVTIADWESEQFVVTGFRTVNIPAFGTVAPHHPELIFDIVDDWESIGDFVTLPNNQSLMSDIVDVNTKPEDYIFETVNSGDRLVSVIIKGHAPGQTEADDKYYRIVMQSNDGDNFMIRRNHHYKINITGMLTYGQNTFEEALVAPASNNAWISIDEWVNEITDGTETLWVEQTAYVLSSDIYAGTDWSFPYKYTSTKGGLTEEDAPTISWIDNNLAYDNVKNEYNPTTGEGTVTLSLYPMYEDNEQQAGTLLIKSGKLQRKVTIHVIRTQYFTPSWITSHIYGVADEYVTIVFTIPESCPESLFPFTVLVSANHLDVRATSGQQLPVFTSGQDGYFGAEWEGINYKYAYTVTEPGKHRLHMKSILQHDDGDTEQVHLEANFFETITKEVVFTGKTSSHKRIFVDGLHNYGSQYADDEYLYYMLMPQKKAAPLQFTIQLQERQSDNTYAALNHAANPGSTQWHTNGADEFLIYSKTFSFYDDYFAHNPGQYEEIKELAWEGEVTMIQQDMWSTNGRVMAFRSYDYDYDENDQYTKYRYGLQEDGSYHIYMLTNSSYVKDVVRVSSNTTGNNHAFPMSRDSLDLNYANTPYAGNTYRSIIFDVAHYRPYRFAAQLRIADENNQTEQLIPATNQLLSNEVHLSTEEAVDDVVFEYEPGELVDIMLDVTSFKGSDGRSVHPFGETFGTEFDIYIDAPMLEIDYSRIPEHWLAANNTDLTQDKLRKDPQVKGRYIYTVAQEREKERAFGYTTAYNQDVSTVATDNFGRTVEGVTIDQTNERKLLPFKKNSITVEGDITISSDTEKVVYWEKHFNVSTNKIGGVIKYEQDGVTLPIPHNAFVAFVRLRTGARIGVITIHEDGVFELDLREEYQFDWDDDPIDFYYTDTEGVTYNLNYEVDGTPVSVDLKTLYALYKSNTPIVLTVASDQEGEE